MEKKGLIKIIIILIAISVILPVTVGYLKQVQGYNEGYEKGFRESQFSFPARWESGLSFDEDTNTVTVYYDWHTFREIAYYICQFGWNVTIPYTIIVYNNTMLEDWVNETGTVYLI